MLGAWVSLRGWKTILSSLPEAELRMGRKRDPKSREAWRKLLEQKQRSGLTVVEFCQREGLSPSAYYAWRRKLHGSPARQMPPAAVVEAKDARAHRKGKASESRPSNAFVQVPLPATSATAWIEVVLAEGTVIRLPQQNLAALQTVLRSLGDGAHASAKEEVRYA